MDFQFRGSGADKTIDLQLHFTWFTIHGFLIPTGLQHGKYGVLYSVTLKVCCHCNHEFYRLVYWYGYEVSKATIVSSFLLIFLTQANVGDFSLADNAILPVVLMVLSLIFAFLSIYNVETKDLN